MGSRSGKVPLSRAKVKLEDPTKLVDATDPDEIDFDGLYAECYNHVFKQKPDRYFSTTPRKSETVRKSATELDCPLRLYILTVMLAHRDTSTNRFYGGLLAGPSAARRVKYYRKITSDTYGVFDPETVGYLAGEKTDSLRESLAASEEVAATFVVGHKVRFLTPAAAHLYETRLLALHPAWLVSEPSFSEWDMGRQVRAHTPLTTEQQRHLARAAAVAKVRSTVTAMRNPLILPIAGKLLRRYGLSLDDVLIKSPITHAMDLWSLLGVAVRQYICLQYIRGEIDTPVAGVGLEIARLGHLRRMVDS